MKPLVVVASVLVRDGLLMIAQRKENANQALKWEFPGGKLEEGETPEEALERELSEELGIQTKSGRIFDCRLFSYPEKTVLLLFYKSILKKGEPSAVDANAVAWVTPEELKAYDFAEADRAVAERLSRCMFSGERIIEPNEGRSAKTTP